MPFPTASFLALEWLCVKVPVRGILARGPWIVNFLSHPSLANGD